MPPHAIAIRTKKATLTKRLIGLAMMLFPARRVRTIGARMTTKAIGKSHNRPNNKIRPGAFCLVIVLLRDSRTANGNTRIKLMRSADIGFAAMFFVGP